jgi:hypothetical protein
MHFDFFNPGLYFTIKLHGNMVKLIYYESRAQLFNRTPMKNKKNIIALSKISFILFYLFRYDFCAPIN